MLEVYERLPVSYKTQGIDYTVVLDSDQRTKGRLKATSTNGQSIGIFLERGKPLQVGECLRSECGNIIIVGGAIEDITEVTTNDWELFSRACYHLGNRHVKVEINTLVLRIKPDHVLEDMLLAMGLSIAKTRAVFNPENGAYANGHNHH